jgi:phosphatidylinositol 4-kinase
LGSQAPSNMSNYFFFKYGSSFNQFPYTRFTDSSIDHKSSTLMFPLGHLQVKNANY